MEEVKNKELTRSVLNEIFISQINKLKSKGVPLNILNAMIKKRSALFDAVLSSPEHFGSGLIPFIPIVPARTLGEFEYLLSYYGIQQSDNLHYKCIVDSVEAPLTPYFMIGVHDNLECPPDLKPGQRSPLLAIEIMALSCHYPNLLGEHHLNAASSKCPDPSKKETEGDVVNLHLNPCRQAVLRPRFYVPGAEGSPSCAGRF